MTRQLLAFSNQLLGPRLLDDLDAVGAAGSTFARSAPIQVEQVSMNLVVDARDAMSGGHLTIETGHLLPGEALQQRTAGPR